MCIYNIYIYYIYINIQIAQQLAKNVPVPTVPSDAHLRFELVATRPKAHKIQKPSTTRSTLLEDSVGLGLELALKFQEICWI